MLLELNIRRQFFKEYLIFKASREREKERKRGKQEEDGRGADYKQIWKSLQTTKGALDVGRCTFTHTHTHVPPPPPKHTREREGERDRDRYRDSCYSWFKQLKTLIIL